MVAGLLRPYEYSNEFSAGAGPSSETTSGSGDRKGKGKSRALWELPDTSILFRRYLDSGRMINVFDWFESFKGVLEAQRKSGLVQGRAAGGNDGDDDDGEVEMPQSPRKKGKKEKEKKSKGKGKKTEVMMRMARTGNLRCRHGSSMRCMSWIIWDLSSIQGGRGTMF